jgi:hypothetical protein
MEVIFIEKTSVGTHRAVAAGPDAEAGWTLA